MVDVFCKDSSTGVIMRDIFSNMNKRVHVWQIDHNNENPERVYLVYGHPEYLTWEKYEEMYGRWTTWYNLTGSYPTYVNIQKPTLPTKSAFHLMVEAHVKFQYINWQTFFMGMGGKGYKYYNNDVYPQGVALDRIQSGMGLNCADISQIGYAVAQDMGYDVMFGHIACAGGGGHIVLLLRGKDIDLVNKPTVTVYDKKWVVYDLAKKISVNSPFTSGGDWWCQSGEFIKYNPSWLMGVDDGVT